MALREEFESSGNWLFRYRSFLPLVLLAVLLAVAYAVPRPFTPADADLGYEFACLCVSLCGLGIRVATIGHTPHRTSGRNTRHQVANTLNTTGIYSVVRHPLYLGNFVIALGIALFTQLWWMALLATLAFALYYERIMFAEEAFLRGKFGAAYEAWAARTPAILPRAANWQPPGLPFSLRNVLKREYNGAFAIVLVFALLDLAQNLGATGQPRIAPWWQALLAVSAALWLLLRSLKRFTRVLHVDGR